MYCVKPCKTGPEFLFGYDVCMILGQTADAARWLDTVIKVNNDSQTVSQLLFWTVTFFYLKCVVMQTLGHWHTRLIKCILEKSDFVEFCS